MNPDNVGSLEACKKLQAAGIVLETEVIWRKARAGHYYLLRAYDKRKHDIPAVSLADAWKELPDSRIGYSKTVKPGVVGYEHHGDWLYYVKDANPADALIELRIWLEGQRKEKK